MVDVRYFTLSNVLPHLNQGNFKEPKKDPSEIFRHENNVEGLRYPGDEEDDIAVDEKGSLLDGDEGIIAGPTAENNPE